MFAASSARRADALSLVLAFACGACTGGGADGSRGAAGASPEGVSYVEQVNAACAGLAGHVGELVRQAVQRRAPNEAPSPEELRSAAEGVRAAVGRSVATIRTLPPPAADRKIVESMLAAFEAGLETLRREPMALESIGTSRPGDPFGRADRLALGYGAERCALSSAAEGGD
jgi:hypothetical protein